MTLHWNWALVTIAVHILDKNAPKPETTVLTTLTIAFQIEPAIPANGPNIALNPSTMFCHDCFK